MKRKIVNKSDIFLFCCIIIAVGIFYVFKPTHSKNVAVIEKNGAEVQRIDLSLVNEPYLINIKSPYPCVILVEKGKISFKEATCPDKLCKKMGKISHPAQTAICLPAGVIIKIEGENTGIDAVTG